MFRVATAVLCLLALFAAPAQASTRNKIIKDCADDGVLEGHYSPSALRDARQHLPSDVAEYTDCADVLRRAEGAGPGGSGSPGGGTVAGGSTPFSAAAAAGGNAPGALLTATTPADQKALEDAIKTGSQPIKVNGESIVPGATGLNAGATRNGIPGTLAVVLVLLSFAGGALTIPAVRKGIPAVIGRFRR